MKKTAPIGDKDYILSLYHELHMCPKVAFDPPKTTALIKRKPEKMGILCGTQFRRAGELIDVVLG